MDIYKALYQYFIEITNQELVIGRDCYLENFNLNEVSDLKDYPILREIQDEIHHEGRWNWLISLHLLDTTIKALLEIPRIHKQVNTESKIVCIDKINYWAEIVIEADPWKYDYTYLKKYYNKADIIVFFTKDKVLIHSLRKQIKFETHMITPSTAMLHMDNKYHLIRDEITILKASDKLFDFTFKDLKKLTLHICNKQFTNEEISELIKNEGIIFMKNKFVKSIIFLFELPTEYLIMFNDQAKSIHIENKLLFTVNEKMFLKISKEKSLDEIIEWLIEVFKRTYKIDHESDDE